MPDARRRRFRELRGALLIVLMLLAVTFACGHTGHLQNALLTSAGASLINRKAAFLNGWAWQDIEQIPNYYQGDSDIGTSSIGTAFLDMYNASGNSAYLNAAEEASNWLVSAQTSAGWWPDYDNPGTLSPRGPANYGFSSLDDGASGQAIFLYRMYQLTGNRAYETAALNGANWLVSYASAPSGQSCPSQQCFWYWWVPSSNGTIVYLGLGSGVAGVFYVLDKLAQWTGNGIYEEYALAGAAYEESQISASSSIVEYAGGNTSSTAFYDGAAGIAFAYYSLYQHTAAARWLADANKIMGWVRSQEIAESSGVVWPHEVGGANPDTANYPSMAYGNAGIGWAELQAYKITGASADLQTAEAAGNYLVVSEQSQPGGLAWEEPFGTTNYYTSEDEGAAGIGYFLYDLHLATGNASYNAAAQGAAKWIQAQAFLDSDGYYWGVNNYVGNGGWQSLKEPSRDWGAAGIGMFGARLSDGPDDQPRDVAGLTGSSSPGFTLLASPSSVTVTQGATGGATAITVIDVGGFTGSVTLTASDLPNGVTASFSANPTPSTSTLTLTADSSAMPETATLTITGTSSGLTASTAIALTVNAPGTISFEQVNSNDNTSLPPSSASSVAVTYTSAQVSGDLNIVVVGWNDITAAVSSVADSAGNNYVLAVGPTISQAGPFTQLIYYASRIKAAAAGANTVTVTFSTGAAYPDVRIAEYGGVSMLDVTAGASGSSASSASGAATTAYTNELVFAANIVATGTSSAGTGFTSRLITDDGDIVEDDIVSAKGSYNAAATLTSAGAWVMQMTTFH